MVTPCIEGVTRAAFSPRRYLITLVHTSLMGTIAREHPRTISVTPSALEVQGRKLGHETETVDMRSLRMSTPNTTANKANES